MKCKFISILFCCGLYSLPNYAQDYFQKSIPIEITLTNTGTFLPGGGQLGIWSATLHPGLQIGTQITYAQFSKSKIYQTAKIGYFHHKYAQNAWQFLTEFGYQYQLNSGLFFSPKIGVGYLHSSPNLEVFTFDNGNYQLQNYKGRHQLMGGITALIGYNFSPKMNIPLEAYLGYNFWVQSPFVNKYVPVLPNNSVQLGVIYRILKK